jgi:hypothetical protein
MNTLNSTEIVVESDDIIIKSIKGTPYSIIKENNNDNWMLAVGNTILYQDQDENKVNLNANLLDAGRVMQLFEAFNNLNLKK